jgi:hypothetical protein
MAVRDAIDERVRRLVAGAESLPIGRGGIAAVWRLAKPSYAEFVTH